MTAARVVVLVDAEASDLQPLRDAGVDVVAGLPESAPEAVALVCSPVQPLGAAELVRLPRLRLISVAGSGIDAVDEDEIRRRNIEIVTCGPVLAEATADVAIGLLIAAARRFVEGDLLVRGGRWRGWTFDGDLGVDVSGATLGLVGYGQIGRQVGTRAAALGLTVLHHTRHDTGSPDWVADLDELLHRSQHVSLHVPLTSSTRHLLDRRRLALLRPDGVVVNTARGPVIDQDALADALEAGAIFGAGLDVYANEPAVSERLLRAPHTVLLPHVGSATASVRRRMLRAAVLAVRDWLAAPTRD